VEYEVELWGDIVVVMGPNTRYGTAPNIFSWGVRGGTPPGKIRLGGLGAQRLVTHFNPTNYNFFASLSISVTL